MLVTVAVENYRSLRQLVVPLGQLNLVTGHNGSGKSNLYRALRLLADSARNGAVAALAREGGLSSTMWAGPAVIGKSIRRGSHQVQGTVRTDSVSLKLGFAGDDFGYAMDLGLPIATHTAFGLDPEVKSEALWVGPVWRTATVIAQRAGPIVRVRDGDDEWHRITAILRPFDSMLSELADPVRAPELIQMRERMRSWRFYDHLRTDADAPARQTRIGTRTIVLGHDGADLAARCKRFVRSVMTPRSTKPSIAPSKAAASTSTTRAVASNWLCVSLECYGRSALPSCLTARYATCFGPRLC